MSAKMGVNSQEILREVRELKHKLHSGKITFTQFEEALDRVFSDV